jgi:hypothetical protein
MINRNNEVVGVMSKDRNDAYLGRAHQSGFTLNGEHHLGRTNYSWFRGLYEILDGHGMPTIQYLLPLHAVQHRNKERHTAKLDEISDQIGEHALVDTAAHTVTHANQTEAAAERAELLRIQGEAKYAGAVAGAAVELQKLNEGLDLLPLVLGQRRSNDGIEQKLASASYGSVNSDTACAFEDTIFIFAGDQIDASVVALEATSECIGLERIYLTGYKQLSQAGIRQLTNKYRDLQHVSLNGCSWVSDAGVTELTEICSHLRSIDLSACREVTNKSLAALADNCHGLEHVLLSKCMGISDSGVVLLAIKCRELQHVNLNECRLSDEGVMALANNCPCLRSIDVSTCTQISDMAVTELVGKCQHLEHINLRGCPQFDVKLQSKINATLASRFKSPNRDVHKYKYRAKVLTLALIAH